MVRELETAENSTVPRTGLANADRHSHLSDSQSRPRTGDRARQNETGPLYGFARLLGDEPAAKLLRKTLKEENEADQALSEIARTVNLQAQGQASGGPAGEAEEEEAAKEAAAKENEGVEETERGEPEEVVKRRRWTTARGLPAA
jgi:hypothetical protein